MCDPVGVDTFNDIHFPRVLTRGYPYVTSSRSLYIENGSTPMLLLKYFFFCPIASPLNLNSIIFKPQSHCS